MRVAAAFLVLAAGACSPGEPGTGKPPFALPPGVVWAGGGGRAPRTTLAVLNGVLRLHVVVPRPAAAVVVTAPGPDFDELARAALPPGPDTGEWRHDFAIPRARIPAGASHLVVYSVAPDGRWGSGQALLP